MGEVEEGVWDLGIVEAPLTKVNRGPGIGARSPKPSADVFPCLLVWGKIGLKKVFEEVAFQR